MRYLALLLTLGVAPLALAHNEQTVGSGENEYTVSLAMNSEPAFTEAPNGLNLTIEDSEGEGVENLETSLTVTVTAPNGSAERELTLRPAGDEPGAYTDDFVLTEPGVYSFHIGGFIGETEVDLTFETHEVAPLADLRFP